MITTGLQLALLGGALIALGAVCLIWRFIPAEPDLADALNRLSPEHGRRTANPPPAEPADRTELLGRWAMKTFPPSAWVRTPTKELAILRIPVARFYGEKLMFAAVGLIIPPFFTFLLGAFGLHLPIVLPVIATLALAAVMFFIPDLNARDDAKKSRAEFSRALGAYIDLVALERNSSSGSRQAMEVAAAVGDSWVFKRLSEELALSRWNGVAPWDALKALADELGLPELEDLASILRLSGEEDAQIYNQLRARSASLRAAMLNTELAKANEIGERMSIPMSLLGVIFMALLVAPALLRVMGGGV